MQSYSKQGLRRRAFDKTANGERSELQRDRVQRKDTNILRVLARNEAIINGLNLRRARERRVDELTDWHVSAIGKSHAGRGRQTLPASVRTDDRRDSGSEFQMRSVHKALETSKRQRLEHRVRCRYASVDHLELIAHWVTSSMSFAAAASSATRLEGPLPC